jgi:hypothetical protein
MKKECMGDAFSAQLDPHGESVKAPAYATIKATTAAPISVSGPMAENWSGPGETSAVIVNREAPIVDVLAWCWGEIVALRSVVRLLTFDGNDIPANVVYETVGHHLDRLPDVLEAAIDGLLREVKKGGAA